eukprot:365458-Chlamydomonas_euryale.AAC.6
MRLPTFLCALPRMRLPPRAQGATRVALYGLGAIRDERLARLFAQAGMVSWCRPEPTEEAQPDDWFNIMVGHGSWGSNAEQ